MLEYQTHRVDARTPDMRGVDARTPDTQEAALQRIRQQRERSWGPPHLASQLLGDALGGGEPFLFFSYTFF